MLKPRSFPDDARVDKVKIIPHLGTIVRSFFRDHVASLSEKDVVQKMVWLGVHGYTKIPGPYSFIYNRSAQYAAGYL